MTDDRHVPFDSFCNFRDLGGYATADGRTTRWRTLYRADSLGRLTGDDDRRRFRDLGIGTVIDPRYPWEIAAKGRLPPAEGVTWLNLSIEHRTYDQAQIDPALDPRRYLADRYAEVAADGTAELRQAIETIAAARAPLRWPGYGRAPAEIIRTFLAELSAGHGSVHRYAAERLQLDDSVVRALRTRLLMSS